MRKIILSGIAGLILLFLGLAIGFIQGKNTAFSILPTTIGAFLFVSYLLIDLKNIFSFLGSKGFKYGTNSFVMTILFLSILIILQIIVVNRKIQYDATKDKLFTLSEQSKKVLNNLENQIKILAFMDKRNIKAKDLLEQYKNQTNKVSYEIVDPNRSPGQAKQYQITSLNTLVLINGIKQEKVEQIDEEKITNSLIKITRDGQKTIYFVEGHGEKSIDDGDKQGISFLKMELEKQNYIVKKIALVQSPEIPQDASMLVLPGVEKDLLPTEINTLKNYINRGGKLVIMTDPDGSENIRTFLSEYGINIRNDIIVDKVSKAFGGDFLVPVVLNYPKNPITENLKAMSFFPLTSSIDDKPSTNDKYKIETILKTTGNSWGETNKELIKQQRAGLDPEDTKGPLAISVLSTIKLENNDKEKSDKKEKVANILVFSDSDFMVNGNFGLPGNSDLMLNSLNWMAEEEDLIAIRPRERESTPLVLNQTQGRLLFWSNIIFMPFTIILFGVFFLYRRRLKTA